MPIIRNALSSASSIVALDIRFLVLSAKAWVIAGTRFPSRQPINWDTITKSNG